MGKKNRQKTQKANQTTAIHKTSNGGPFTSHLPLIALVVAITAVCLYPMLNNSFTNWDDEHYVINNMLLRGPDWQGIFSTPVVSNYHPLTVLSLAINYQISGLDPTSYFMVNLLLHLANTVLVFYFIWLIADKKVWVAFFTALIFGIHPMHVESVAWISERKDVLYTFFFMLSLIQYWRFLQTGKTIKLWLCFFLFVLSLLSKPAAIILPLVLLLLDYWYDRKITSKVVFEKTAFFLLAFIFGVLTIKIQSVSAIAGFDLYPIWSRPLFACYVTMTYLIRFIIPYPLSAFHPYPPINDLGTDVLVSPFFMIGLLAFLWYKRKNKTIIFGFLFFIINLLLVLQVLSIGTTIVSERYTYVPYIGLAFMLGMYLNNVAKAKAQPIFWTSISLVTAVFGYMTFQRTKVWKDSLVLWNDVISHYPKAPQPRTNRANYLLKLLTNPENKIEHKVLLAQALEDCNVSLKSNPKHAKGYENREFIHYYEKRYQAAIEDATQLIKLEPNNKLPYAILGASYRILGEPQKALTNLNASLALDPMNEFALDNRATLLFNAFQNYKEALTDFNKAIEINPKGSYYLNRSYCHYYSGDVSNAKMDAQVAIQKGVTIPDNFRRLLSL